MPNAQAQKLIDTFNRDWLSGKAIAERMGWTLSAFKRAIGTGLVPAPGCTGAKGDRWSKAEADRIVARAATMVRGWDFAQRLGLKFSAFQQAVRTGLFQRAESTDDQGNGFWCEETVAATVARHRRNP